jgi:hypothetical protein
VIVEDKPSVSRLRNAIAKMSGGIKPNVIATEMRE